MAETGLTAAAVETLTANNAKLASLIVEVEKMAAEILSLRAAQAEAQRERETFSAENELRKEWWINHPCDTVARYGDDGEMQCGRCRTDFKRLPLPELLMRVTTLRRERMERALAAPSSASIQRAEQEPTCVWTHEDTHDSWDSGCGGKFILIDSGPTENGMKFCRYCGGKLLAAPTPETEEPK